MKSSQLPPPLLSHATLPPETQFNYVIPPAALSLPRHDDAFLMPTQGVEDLMETDRHMLENQTEQL